MPVQQTNQEPSILRRPVVVFSKNYLPLTQITVKRAIALLVTERAESLTDGSPQWWEVRSPSTILQVSQHIRLVSNHGERHWQVPPVSRREVFRRDQHRCQYCGSPKQLTIDHVIPRSKGGTHTWDNVVTACARCNTTKGDRLLPLPNLVLQTKPKPPIHPVIAFAEQFWTGHSP